MTTPGRATRGVRTAVLAAALLCFGGTVRGAEPAIELSASPAQTIEVPITIGVPGLMTEVRLRNTLHDATGARTFRLGGTLLRKGDGLAIPALWKRLDTAAGGAAAIAPGAELVLELSADVREPGIYETWIDTSVPATETAPEAPDRRIHVLVTRESAALPADVLVEPKPVRQVRWPFAGGVRTLIVRMQNTTTKPVEFAAPAVLAFDLKTGDKVNTIAAAKLPILDARNCPSPLAAGTRCALTLAVPRALSPGQYTIDLGVGGIGGGWSQTTATISVRWPLLIAFLATALGTGAGWYVQAWRASGRRALTGLIDAATLRRRLDAIIADVPGLDLGLFRQPILDAIGQAEARCRSGADVAADLDGVSARIARLSAFVAVERVFQALPAVAQAMLAAPHAQFMQQSVTMPSDQNTAAFETNARALASNVGGWPMLVVARNDATARLATIDRLLSIPTDDAVRAPVVAVGNDLRAAVTAAMAAIPAAATGTELSERATALVTARDRADEAATAALTTYADALRTRLDAVLNQGGLSDEMRARATAAIADLGRIGQIAGLDARVALLTRLWPASAVPVAAAEAVQRGGLESVQAAPGAAPAALPALDVPVAIAFDLTPGRSLASLQRERQRNEIVTNLIILAATALSGVVLVASNDTWGSAADVITMILGGLGSRVILGELGAATQPAAAR